MSLSEFGLLCVGIALLIAIYNLYQETQPNYRSGCQECAGFKRNIEIMEKRRQEKLREELADSRRLGDEFPNRPKPVDKDWRT